MSKSDYESKLERERRWWERHELGDGVGYIVKTHGIIGKLLTLPIIYSTKRMWHVECIAKNRMVEVIKKHYDGAVENMLVAPCGDGKDFIFLKDCARNIYGIDISPIAIGHCPPWAEVKVGDIRYSGYEDGLFDLVASPYFFHHYNKWGYEMFMREFYRVLKPKGGLVALESSIFYPLFCLTRPMKVLLGNFYGEVEDESPLNPKRMIEAMRASGFKNIKCCGATFSHPLMHRWVAEAVDICSKPLLNIAPFKYMTCLTIYWGEK